MGNYDWSCWLGERGLGNYLDVGRKRLMLFGHLLLVGLLGLLLEDYSAVSVYLKKKRFKV